ncbi:hypothetical protein ACEWY4_020946 [Coilia grayii]|uniref:N-acetyllactosaminide beta-1,3-N-acetylglucosaminyltransferase 2 n=1 Tax=Coilia grayii TaxID=363190 RepID=A0ABD1J7M2_9TELE
MYMARHECVWPTLFALRVRVGLHLCRALLASLPDVSICPILTDIPDTSVDTHTHTHTHTHTNSLSARFPQVATLGPETSHCPVSEASPRLLVLTQPPLAPLPTPPPPTPTNQPPSSLPPSPGCIRFLPNTELQDGVKTRATYFTKPGEENTQVELNIAGGQERTRAAMHSTRRKMKVVGSIAMVNIFLFIVLSRSGGQSKGGSSKVQVPSKRFWAKLAPSSGFWNREQQRLDLLNNPVMTSSNSSTTAGAGVGSGSDGSAGPLPFERLPDWLNDTAVGLESCEPDPRVETQIKDFQQLPQRFKDFLTYMRCRSYRMVVDQPHVCQDGGPFLLLAIKSLAPHFDRRQAIRESWGRVGRMANRTVATVFLLGGATAADHFPDLSAMLRYENQQHADLLQWDYRDTFFNLTVKEVLFLDWLSSRCPGASFIFKGDDDVFVNTPRILDFLKGLTPDKARDLFVGDVITNAGPHRDKRVKYFIPESMFVGMYPAYAGGGGYLYSGDLARRLLAASNRVALYPIDDVYTGMCLRKLGLAPEKHKGFRTFDIEEKLRNNPCTYRALMLVHPRTPQDMIKIWGWLNDPKVNCP